MESDELRHCPDLQTRYDLDIYTQITNGIGFLGLMLTHVWPYLVTPVTLY